MRDPRSATDFDWDEANEEHLGERGITPAQIERIFDYEPKFFRNKGGRSGVWMMTGKDPVSGRVLKVAIRWEDEKAGILRAVTAFDA